jgi:hypothetical protein
MLGLMSFAVIGLWIFISIKLSKWFFRNTEPPSKRRLWTTVALVLLLVAPVADEVVGGAQFFWLCNRERPMEAQFAQLAGRTLIQHYRPYKRVDGTLLNVKAWTEIYMDSVTGAEVLSYKTYEAGWGWVFRTTGLVHGVPRSCVSIGNESPQDWLRRYEIKLTRY